MAWLNYGKTKNITDGKNLRYWLANHPEIYVDRFIVTEKIDGSNFQIFFEKGKDVGFGSRNQKLGIDASFFDFQKAVLRDCSEQIELLQALVDRDPFIDTLNIYGELYGNGVQRRIQYSTEQHFLPFHMRVNDMPVCANGALDILESAGILDWWVPIVKSGITLDEALEIDVESLKTLVPQDCEGNRLVEGVVIEPMYSDYTLDDGTRLVLKKKSKGFCDKSGHKSKDRKPHKVSDEGQDLYDKFSAMFNDNRLCDLESKVGPIEEMSQMGEYIKLMGADVCEDFLSEYRDQFVYLPQDDRKLIMGSCGRLAAEVLKNKLNK